MRFSPHPAQASTKAPFRHPVSRLNFSCCLHNTRLQPLDLTLNISPCQAGRCSRQCNSVHLLFFCKRGSTNSLVTRDHKEVCPLSRGVTFKPLSARLQGGIRFFLIPLPAPPSASLAVRLPDVPGGDTGLPCFIAITRIA